jgi:hypothetical protein
MSRSHESKVGRRTASRRRNGIALPWRLRLWASWTELWVLTVGTFSTCSHERETAHPCWVCAAVFF